MTAIVVLLLLVLVVLYAGLGLKKVHEHEQGVIMRFGRFYQVVPPGLALVVPFVDELRRVDLRTLLVEQRIDPQSGTGRVRLWDESWPARSLSGEPIGPGTTIRVAGVDGKHVIVEPADLGSPS